MSHQGEAHPTRLKKEAAPDRRFLAPIHHEMGQATLYPRNACLFDDAATHIHQP
jgi:hypothetical protein